MTHLYRYYKGGATADLAPASVFPFSVFVCLFNFLLVVVNHYVMDYLMHSGLLDPPWFSLRLGVSLLLYIMLLLLHCFVLDCIPTSPSSVAPKLIMVYY